MSNLYSANSNTDKIYKHSGFTTTISSSIAAPSTGCRGISWNNPNFHLYSNDWHQFKSYKHSGFSTTILSSIAAVASNSTSSSWGSDSNFYEADNVTSKIYRHSGFSTTILSSIAAPVGDARSVSWDNRTAILYSTDQTSLMHYKHSGFTTTILSSIATVSTVPENADWEDRDYSSDIPEFIDSMVDTGSGTADLNTRNLQTPSVDKWERIGTGTLIKIDKDNDYAFSEDDNTYNNILYRPDTTNYSDEKQYAQSYVLSTDGSPFAAKVGVGCRYVSKGMAAVLAGSSPRKIRLVVVQGTAHTNITSVDFAWVDNTWYKIRIEAKNLTGSDVEFKVYVDDVLKMTYTYTDATLYGNIGRPVLHAKNDQPGWTGGEQHRWKNFVAGTISIDTHEFAGSANTTFGGSVSIESHRIFDGVADANFDGEIELHGGIVPFDGTENVSFDGSSLLNGQIKEFGTSANVSFDGAVTSFVSQKLFSGNSAAIFDGNVSMAVGDFSFRWSIDNLEARTDYGFPTVYVDIDKDTLPKGVFPEGEFYDRRLLQMPRIAETELDTRFGISGFQRVTFTVDNSDRLITGIDLQDSFVRMYFVDENGSVYKEFNGKVVDWTLSHQVTINAEDIDAIALTQDLPKRTLNNLIEAEKIADAGFAANVVADDLGKPIPIIFGRAVKVPLLYVKADGGQREYDYIIGEGAGLNSKFFQEVFTVYRDSAAVSTEVGALDNIEGTMVSATSTTIVLENNDRRPDSWYKYWWVEMLTGNAAGEITDVTAYDSTNNRCTVSTWGTTPTSGTYRLREWRFFDGSQVSPYAGYAFIRFKKRMGERGRTEPLYADVNGLEDEVNVVNAINSLLTNSDWGFGLTVNETSFSNAADLLEIKDMKCEGVLLNTTSSSDLLRELLGFRDMVLAKNS